MAKFNTDSNGYTLGFLAIMVIIVGGSLALVSSALKPTIDANQELDRRTKVLKSILSLSEEEENTKLNAEFVNKEYDEKVKGFLVDFNGDVANETIPSDYNFRKEVKDKTREKEEKLYPVFSYEEDGSTVYVFQMIGSGLWDEINGFLAIYDDGQTIKGVAFDHVGETPGLGAELVKNKFREQFYEQNLFDEDGKYDFVVYKAGKLPKDGKGVDGLAGATLTTDGIHDMVKNTIKHYSNFLSKI